MQERTENCQFDIEDQNSCERSNLKDSFVIVTVQITTRGPRLAGSPPLQQEHPPVLPVISGTPKTKEQSGSHSQRVPGESVGCSCVLAESPPHTWKSSA